MKCEIGHIDERNFYRDRAGGIATSDFVYPKTRGHRPVDFERRLQFNIALVRLGAQDPSIHKLMFEVNHLLKPQSALRAPEVAERVATLMAAPA